MFTSITGFFSKPLCAIHLLLLALTTVFISGKVQANIPADEHLFLFTVDATIADKTNAGAFEIPSDSTNYRYIWEEVGSESTNNSNGYLSADSAYHLIQFSQPGVYRIAIDPSSVSSGVNDFDHFSFGVSRSGDEQKMISIEQWGTTPWRSMSDFMYGASNFTGIIASDSPDFSSLTSLRAMFAYTPSFTLTGGMRNWQLSSVTSTADMFTHASSVDPDVSLWDVSSVESMIGMFANTSANPNVQSWDVSSVKYMQQLFANNDVATPNTSAWDTSSVLSMSEMFLNSASANPDTSNWNTQNVQSFDYMFAGTSVANPNTSGWDMSSAIFLNHMFQDALLANPDTSNWDTRNVSRMQRIFQNATAANPNVSNWDFSMLAHEGYDRMFDNSGMSTFNYDGFLTNISSIVVHSGIYFHTGVGVNYCMAVQARTNIVNTRSWYFGDGGLDCTEYNLKRALEDSQSPGGASNADGVAITGAQLQGITGLLDVNASLEAYYQVDMAEEENFSNPPLVNEIQVIVDRVNTYYEILEDSQSIAGSQNANEQRVTALQLFQIPGLYGIQTDHEPEYQYYIAAASTLSELPSRPQIQSIINQGNMAAAFRQAVREDSTNGGGSNNADGVAVTAMTLSNIVGVESVRQEHEAYYQEYIAHESSFDYSGLPLVSDIQLMIDDIDAWVNGGNNWRSDENHFKFILVDNVSSFTVPSSNFNYQLHWEEVGSEWIYHSHGPIQITSSSQTIDFGKPGKYLVSIDPINVAVGVNDFNRIIGGRTDSDKIETIEQWGSTVWSTTRQMFEGATGLQGFGDIDIPNLTAVSDMSRMFSGSSALVETGRIGDWDVSNVVNMYALFRDATEVNPNLSDWDVSSVTTMEEMFINASSADASLNSWDVSSVSNMSYMFRSAGDVSQDLAEWDTSSVTNMRGMFLDVSSNPDVSAWDVSSVETMLTMFTSAASAAPDINAWDMSSVVEMDRLFAGSNVSNVPFESWDISSVQSMRNVFPQHYFPDGNYDVLLEALNEADTRDDVVFEQLDSTYCTAERIRQQLIDTRGWSIVDGGRDCSAFPAYEIAEDSGSEFGSGNEDGIAVTVEQLALVVGNEASVNPNYERFYQVDIAAETNFSYPTNFLGGC